MCEREISLKFEQSIQYCFQNPLTDSEISYISEKTLTDCRLADIMQKKINVLGINVNIPSINLASELICK